MLVLLPPSETKSAPAAGPALDLTGLSAPGLAPARATVLDALVALVGQSTAPHAAAVLGTGPSLADEVARNARLREVATARAATVYTGVLYETAGLATLPPAAA
ncbi:MAG: peroxide stress protein YaaA, partial [Actinobacteria bacterium]|nr:peroxide stress protein YaaA [Actinomycetota bacterium]